MRTLALLLVLLNVCFLFWAQYIDVDDPNASAGANLATVTTQRLQLATERNQSTIIARKNLALQSCISIGPFAQITDENTVEQKLREAGYAVTTRTERGDVFAGFWVSLPAFSTRLEAETALAKLHTNGIDDAYLLTEETPPNVISLGLFSEQGNAERRRDEVIKLGFTPTIQSRNRTGELGWIDIKLKQPGQDIDPTLLQPQVGAILRLESKACLKTS
jgi:hypothetical protein